MASFTASGERFIANDRADSSAGVAERQRAAS
jgi:hypothetical protein